MVWNTVQAGKSVWEIGRLVQDPPWSVVCVRDPCLEAVAKLCFLNLSPVSHQEPFLAGISFFSLQNGYLQ